MKSDLIALAQALRQFHQAGTLPAGFPNIRIGPGQAFVDIDYGDKDVENAFEPYGMLRMTRDQFQVIYVGPVISIDTVVEVMDYNYPAGMKITEYATYYTALYTTLPSGNLKDALIIMTAECARSNMVLGTMVRMLERGLKNYQLTMPDGAWGAMDYALHNYKKTAVFAGYKIHAGEVPWSPLIRQNYINYLNSAEFKGDKAKELAHMQAIFDFVQ